MRRTTIMAMTMGGLALFCLAAAFQGCSPSQDIGGTAVQNALPDTRITGTPPVLRQTDFIVHFYWTGFDLDGEVKGYQWKIANNGVDGIGVYDTLTVDPATGDTLHPWFFTTATDSVFIVTADSSGYAGDADLPPDLQRFFQPHTLFVRAVDDRGQVDPTPAQVTFTATTLAPTVGVARPQAFADPTVRFARTVPPTFTLYWTGSDPDFELGKPVQVRYLLKEARLPDGSYVQARSQYEQYVDELIRFSDPGWSDWVPFGQNDEDRKVTFSLPSRDAAGNFIYYLFALQARDTAGAVSLDRGYARAVHNFRIDETKRPLLVVREQFLGTFSGIGDATPKTVDIAKNQPLLFNWTGEANSYGGEVAGYRYGWDVREPDNDADPGWQVQFGLSPLHQRAPVKTFASGSHTLLVQCIDNSGQLTTVTIIVNVVPVPDVEDQRPVLLVDGIVDQESQSWPNPDGSVHYGNDVERDAFWSQALARSGGVAGFSEAEDVVDLESNSAAMTYRRAVNYRTVIWTLDPGQSPIVDTDFQMERANIGGQNIVKLPFNWLATYQHDVGNLFLVGAGAIASFQNSSPVNPAISWMFPIIFDNTDDFKSCNNLGQQRAIGYGTSVDIDGNRVALGPLSYPYASLGLSVLSQVVPNYLYVQGDQCFSGANRRDPRCVGPKGLVLDQQFRERHVGQGALPDTVYMWPEVDWQENGDIHLNWSFGKLVELYDFNGSERADPWSPQVLPDGTPAIEPMWRIYARYDWLLDEHLRNGDTSYPDFDPVDVCGIMAINSMTGRTRVDGAPVGFFSYKAAATKPGGKADVVWGFEPSIYQRDKMIRTIQWLLGDYFGLPMAP